jgi:hypothetical protein
MNQTGVARTVSIAGHPFVFIVLLALLSVRAQGNAREFRVASIAIVIALLPLALFMWQRYASGRWQTFDASEPTNRPTLHLASLAVLLPLSLYFLLVARSPILFRGVVVVAVMLALFLGLNRWIKLSGHLAFAGFSAVILTRVHLAYGLPILLFIPLIGWSRLKLSRHTFPEVVGGLASGLIAGGLMLLK